VPANAASAGCLRRRNLPAGSKVHRQAERLIEDDLHILFIGHAGHPEVIGTFGQVPDGSMTLVETVEDAPPSSVADPAAGVPHPDDPFGRRHRRDRRGAQAPLSRHRAPRSEDICYATSNRQAAVKAIAPNATGCWSSALPTAATRFACRGRRAPERAGAADRARQRHRLGLAWRSRARWALPPARRRPELLVREVIDALRERFDVSEERRTTAPSGWCSSSRASWSN
jgi:4-hydroxy-3-methylbut-2-en-1-yl diphosphate reductase